MIYLICSIICTAVALYTTFKLAVDFERESQAGPIFDFNKPFNYKFILKCISRLVICIVIILLVVHVMDNWSTWVLRWNVGLFPIG